MPKASASRGKAKGAHRKEASAKPATSGPVLDVPGPTPKLKLRLSFKGKSGNSASVTPTRGFEQDGGSGNDEEADQTVPVAEPAGRTTRHGRVVRMPKHNDDYVFGAEMDEEVKSLSKQKANNDDGDAYQYKHKKPASCNCDYDSESAIFDETNSNTTVKLPSIPSAPTIPDDNQDNDSSTSHSSNTIAASPQGSLPEIQTGVHDLFNSLRSSDIIYIDLPSLSNAANPHKDLAYTAPFLTQLYLLSYTNRLWPICDLIADTWIRAFHALRKNSQLNPAHHHPLWRPNKALEARMKITKTNLHPRPFDAHAPQYNLAVQDPLLDADVTSFDAALLNTLYDNTGADCGARLLWADAMALTGERMDEVMRRARRRGVEWHEGLKHDIMCTSLRMVRRKLTLKIEEGTEGAWCARYHEHGKHGLPCYREVAWRNQGGEDEEDDEDDEEDSDAMGE